MNIIPAQAATISVYFAEDEHDDQATPIVTGLMIGWIATGDTDAVVEPVFYTEATKTFGGEVLTLSQLALKGELTMNSEAEVRLAYIVHPLNTIVL